MVGYEDRHCLEQQYNVTLWSLPLHCDCTILLWGSGSWEPGNSWNTPGALLSFAQSIMSKTGIKKQSHFQSKVWVTVAGAVSPP